MVTHDGVFGAWLGAELERRDMTQAELANRVGVSPAAVSRWVSGQRLPDILLSERIADALRIDHDIVLAQAGHVRFEEQRGLELRQEIEVLRAEQRRLREELDRVGREIAAKEAELEQLEARQPRRLAEFMASLRAVVDEAPLDEEAREQLWEGIGTLFEEAIERGEFTPRASFLLPLVNISGYSQSLSGRLRDQD